MKSLSIQKRLAGSVLGCSPSKIILDNERLEEIKEAITKADIRALISKGAITRKPVKGASKWRARRNRKQKVKGGKTGHGSRKGKAGARSPKKRNWINKIRAQRDLLKILKDKKVIGNTTYRMLYMKSKGGFFRSRRHIKLYITEHELK